MKKVLLTAIILILFITFHLSLITYPVYADCTPPTDYSSCVDQHPDYNLNIRGWESISGSLNLIPFSHPIDSASPQLSTMSESATQVTSLRQVYDWDWFTNSRGGLISRPSDAPNDFATLVGFAANGNILVPESGYDLGGFEVLVLYATSDQILIKYTLEDSIVTGYAIHFLNINVNPELVAFYNQLNQAGRGELPALVAGEIVGQASGEVWVAIRDTGSFMDPRWINDWWQTNRPGSAVPFTPKTGGVAGISPFTPFDPLVCKPIIGEDYMQGCGSPIEFNQSITYSGSDPNCISKNFEGELRITGFDIPFAEDLADYFAGVLDIDHVSPSTSQIAWRQCLQNPVDCLKKAGVSKKLLDQITQDNLKIAFLEEVIERKAMNQNTRYRDLRLSGMTPEAIRHRFLGIRDKRANKEELTSEDITFLREVWFLIPLFANEESEGSINISGNGISGNVRTSIPDIYRLAKSTEIIQSVLYPDESNIGAYNAPKQTIVIADYKKPPSRLSVLAKNTLSDFLINVGLKKKEASAQEKILLAQNWEACSESGDACATMSIESVSCSGRQCCVVVNGEGYGHANVYINGSHEGVNNRLGPGLRYCVGSPGPNQTFAFNIVVHNLDVVFPDGGHYVISLDCIITTDENGNGSCGGGTIPPADTCPETKENEAILCMDEAEIGPPQTPVCSELENQEYPNVFGNRQFKNDQGCGQSTISLCDPLNPVCPVGSRPVNNGAECDCISTSCSSKTVEFETIANVINDIPFLGLAARATISDKGIFRVFIPWLEQQGYLDFSEDTVVAIHQELDNPLPAEDEANYSLQVTQADSGFSVTTDSSGKLRLLFGKLGTIFNMKEILSENILFPNH